MKALVVEEWKPKDTTILSSPHIHAEWERREGGLGEGSRVDQPRKVIRLESRLRRLEVDWWGKADVGLGRERREETYAVVSCACTMVQKQGKAGSRREGKGKEKVKRPVSKRSLLGQLCCSESCEYVYSRFEQSGVWRVRVGERTKM